MAAIDKLTGKQRAFVEAYLLNPNATEAAKAAGYALKSAHSIGHENLDKPKIAAAIAEAREARSDRVKIDADYVLQRHRDIDEMDVLDIMDDDGGMKPLSQWPKIWRQFLSGLDVAEIFEGRGNERQIVGMLKKIKWPDKLKNLELMGKHVDVSAYRENHDHSSRDGSMSPASTIDPSKLSTDALKELMAAREIAGADE